MLQPSLNVICLLISLIALVIQVAACSGEAIQPTPTLPLGSPVVETNTWPTDSGLATFNNQVRLLSYDLPTRPLSPGRSVKITLIWQSRTDPTPYNVFLHLFDADNTLVVQADFPLADAPCPETSRFSAGLTVTCAVLNLPDSLTAGRYQLTAGVYDPGNGQRLTTAEGESELALTPIEVQAQAETRAGIATPLPACPVTSPNGLAPPGEQPSPDYLSNGQLWTVLWPSGKVIFERGGPGAIHPDGSLEMKWGWWRGVKGQLTITGRRLDAPAAPLRADIPSGYGESGFQATGLTFSSAGCWEVTGRVGEAELTFVTLVVNTTAEK